MDSNDSLQQAIEHLKAVGDDTRARLLLVLEGQPLCLDHLTRIFNLAPSTLSAHLRTLAATGLVRMTREKHWHYYHLPPNDEDQAGAALRLWLRQNAGNDPCIDLDLSRRTVAIGDSDAPVPRFMKANVLFLCTGNSCRSQMAEALLRAKAGDRFHVYSAGLEPREIPEMTIAVMDEMGIDLHNQASKNVLDYLGHVPFEYLITVCENAETRCPVFPGVSKRLCWPLPDPLAVNGPPSRRLAEFRRVRDDICARLEGWLTEIDTPGSQR